MYARNNVVSTNSAASSSSMSGTSDIWELESWASMEGEKRILISVLLEDSALADRSVLSQRDSLKRMSAR